MKILFLGTRAFIETRSSRHRRHSALLVTYLRRRVMVDCGRDWLGELDRVRPRAVVVTHAHADHVGGLSGGAPCPVYATREAWASMSAYPLGDRETVEPRVPFTVHGIEFEAFRVDHSLRAPAVGYRITAGNAAVFYVPDVVEIHDRSIALSRLKLYVGDGATITRPIVRGRDGARIGHASVRTQLDWCRAAGVPRAVFTHCGTEIVTGDERALGPAVRRMGRERGVEVEIAHDGMELTIR